MKKKIDNLNYFFDNFITNFVLQKIKRGASFAETSPMLNDISSMADWAKVCTGLMRMFQGKELLFITFTIHIFWIVLYYYYYCRSD